MGRTLQAYRPKNTEKAVSALFFPEPLLSQTTGPEGFVSLEHRALFYRRQELSSLDFQGVMGDSDARPSMAPLKLTFEGIPERNFCQYFREDGTDFYAGTVGESPFTYPGIGPSLQMWKNLKTRYRRNL